MQWLHPVVVAFGLTFWLVFGIFVYMVRVEHQGKLAREKATRQYIHAAAQINSALEIVSGRLNQCEAVTY